MTEAVRPN